MSDIPVQWLSAAILLVNIAQIIVAIAIYRKNKKGK